MDADQILHYSSTNYPWIRPRQASHQTQFICMLVLQHIQCCERRGPSETTSTQCSVDPVCVPIELLLTSSTCLTTQCGVGLCVSRYSYVLCLVVAFMISCRVEGSYMTNLGLPYLHIEKRCPFGRGLGGIIFY